MCAYYTAALFRNKVSIFPRMMDVPSEMPRSTFSFIFFTAGTFSQPASDHAASLNLRRELIACRREYGEEFGRNWDYK